jgi:DNA-directed RNA polymerase subunit RPC12/RpoP
MPINFKCANCGRPVTAPDSAAGKKTNCPTCGIMIFLPRPPKPEEDIGVAPETEESAAIARKLEQENREVEAALGRSVEAPDDDVDEVEEVVDEPPPAPRANEVEIFELENAVIDWMTAVVKADKALLQAARNKLRGRAGELAPIVEGIDVTLLMDNPLSELSEAKLRALKGKLVPDIEKLPPA